ncbi:MAG TPA: cell division protein SepF [Clostridiales bacterium]|nr:cell division protein SepF [Clostridiales bacterium]
MGNKFFKKMLNIIGLDEDVVYEDYEPEEEVHDTLNVNEDTDHRSAVRQRKKAKVVNLHTTKQMRIVLYQPFSYEDCQNIVDNLRNRKPVIVNLESMDVELAKKTLNFLSGAVYALDGVIQKISKVIFLLAPNNVDISGNIPEELMTDQYFPFYQDEE